MRAFPDIARRAGIAAICLVLSGCANPDQVRVAQGMSAEMAAEIEAICGLPSGALNGQTPVSDAMPKIACAIEEARKRNVAVGFVSNPADPDR